MRNSARGGFDNGNAAREANLQLMQDKRRRQLEEQLQNKMEILQQYTNPRGLGMGGHMAPQRDIDLLKQQIEQLRQAITECGGTAPARAGPVAAAAAAGAIDPRLLPSAHAVASSAASSAVSTRSVRDEVWERRYGEWRRRQSAGGYNGGILTEVPLTQEAMRPGPAPVVAPAPSQQPGQPSWLEVSPQRQMMQPAVPAPAPAPAPQFAQPAPAPFVPPPPQIEEAIRHGRRSTPGTSQPGMVSSMQQQQQQQQQPAVPVSVSRRGMANRGSGALW
jgi:hypothetical protein